MEGYAKIAEKMGAHPEIAILRRFATLRVQNLLYLQAELIILESRLREYMSEDIGAGRTGYAVDWDQLSKSVYESAPDVVQSIDEIDAIPPEQRQWSTMLLIRKKIKEYEEAVLRHVELAKLEHPKNRELKLLQNWLKRPDYGGVYLIGEDRDIWKEPNLQDLFAVLPRGDDSPLYSFITGQVLYIYHRLIGRHIRSFRKKIHTQDGDNLAYYSEDELVRLTRVLAMAFSSILPVAAIFALYYVHSMPRRLALVAAFTTAFSIILSLVTNGPMVDVFSASAAFAAVQVVFVGTANVTLSG